MIDFLVASNDLAPFITLESDLEGVWSPHLGLRGSIDVDFDELEKRVLIKPKRLEGNGFGPDLAREHHVARANSACRVQQEPSYPICAHAYDRNLTFQYASFSCAMESLIVSREPHTTGSHTGRSVLHSFKIVKYLPPNLRSATQRNSCPEFWSNLKARLSEQSQKAEALKVKLAYRKRARGDPDSDAPIRHIGFPPVVLPTHHHYHGTVVSPGDPAQDDSGAIFTELFAGTGVLTRRVQLINVPTIVIPYFRGGGQIYETPRRNKTS